MEPIKKQGAQPSEDKRWRLVNRTMRLHGYSPDALIETLHSVQEHFGFLDLDSLKYVATQLRVPLSRVYGVATFYHYFMLKPPGRHTCVVCKGTACYISGASDILHALEEAEDLRPGETTSEGSLSLVTARCLGSCGLAPAVIFDGEVCARVTPQEAVERARRLRQDDSNA